jgi:hypothetical protein
MPRSNTPIYNFLLKRNPIYFTAMIGAAFVIEYTGGGLVDWMWNTANKGVRNHFSIYSPQFELRLVAVM